MRLVCFARHYIESKRKVNKWVKSSFGHGNVEKFRNKVWIL